MPLEPVNLYEYEARAKQVLPHNVWDFPAGGSMDEVTMRRNRSAFEAIALRPRFLWDVSQRDLTTTVLGSEISMPLMIAPASTQMMAHPEGEVATIRAAGMSGTLMMLSIGSNRRHGGGGRGGHRPGLVYADSSAEGPDGKPGPPG